MQVMKILMHPGASASIQAFPTGKASGSPTKRSKDGLRPAKKWLNRVKAVKKLNQLLLQYWSAVWHALNRRGVKPCRGGPHHEAATVNDIPQVSVGRSKDRLPSAA
jgi:hypothetical protein